MVLFLRKRLPIHAIAGPGTGVAGAKVGDLPTRRPGLLGTLLVQLEDPKLLNDELWMIPRELGHVRLVDPPQGLSILPHIAAEDYSGVDGDELWNYCSEGEVYLRPATVEEDRLQVVGSHRSPPTLPTGRSRSSTDGPCPNLLSQKPTSPMIIAARHGTSSSAVPEGRGSSVCARGGCVLRNVGCNS